MLKIAVSLLLASSSATAAEPPGPAQNADCTAAIATAERTRDIPAGLLAAIGHIESGRADPVDGTDRPWPWAINADGAGHFFATKAEAVAATAGLLSRGVVSVDVGCLQVNLAYHPAAFASLEEAFDPLANALYAARYLSLLFSQTRDWRAAVAAYHSQTHEIGAAYQGKVLAAWAAPGSALPPPAASRPPEFNRANWIGAGWRDGEPWWPAPDGKFAAWQIITPVEAPPWIGRAIAAVTDCAMSTETHSPLPAALAETAASAHSVRGKQGREWKGVTAGNCPASPFTKPAALRQLLAGAWSNQVGR